MGVIGRKFNLEQRKLAGRLGVHLENGKNNSVSVPAVVDLRSIAEKSIQNDPDFRKVVSTHKDKITAIFHGCLEKNQENGDAVCDDAPFPRVHPFDFQDIQALANHDFTIDLHADEVDEVLKAFTEQFLNVAWNHVNIENTEQTKVLRKQTEELHTRMEMMESNLRDRTEQLSNCRFSYFLEISQLRNQLYLRNKVEDDFEPRDVYYFDPSEFLDEEIRNMLNQKIKRSVKSLHYQLQDALSELDALRRQLELTSCSLQGAPDLSQILRGACVKYGSEATVHELAELARQEMEAWAASRYKRNADDLAEIDELKAALRKLETEAADERRGRLTAESERQRLKEEVERSQAEIRRLVSDAKAATIMTKSTAAVDAEFQQKIASLEQELKREGEMRDLIEKQLSDARKKLDAALAERERLRLSMPCGSNMTDAEQMQIKDYLRGIQSLTEYLGEFCEEALHTESDDLCTGVDTPLSRRRSTAVLRPSLGSASVQNFGGEGQTSIVTYIDGLAALLREAQEREGWVVKQLKNTRQALEAAEVEVSRARAAESESQRLMVLAQEEVERSKSELEGERSKRIRPSVGSRSAAAVGGGFECEAQTNITASGVPVVFSLLEAPPSEAERAVQLELEDLTECANGNWDGILERIRSAQRPPRGTGTGQIGNGPFVRLFETSRQRLRRHGEMMAMCIALKRVEMQRILEGVHLLMESDLPSCSVDIRDLLFGRGFTQSALDRSTTFLEFASLEKRWDRLAARIGDELRTLTGDVLLGEHVGRRMFIIGGGGGRDLVDSGGMNSNVMKGSGGGLAARQVRAFSPPPPPQEYDGVAGTYEEDAKFAGTLSRLLSRLEATELFITGQNTCTRQQQHEVSPEKHKRQMKTRGLRPFADEGGPHFTRGEPGATDESDPEAALEDGDDCEFCETDRPDLFEDLARSRSPNPHLLPSGKISVLSAPTGPTPSRHKDAFRVSPLGAGSAARLERRTVQNQEPFRGSLAGLLADVSFEDTDMNENPATPETLAIVQQLSPKIQGDRPGPISSVVRDMMAKGTKCAIAGAGSGSPPPRSRKHRELSVVNFPPEDAEDRSEMDASVSAPQVVSRPPSRDDSATNKILIDGERRHAANIRGRSPPTNCARNDQEHELQPGYPVAEDCREAAPKHVGGAPKNIEEVIHVPMLYLPFGGEAAVEMSARLRDCEMMQQNRECETIQQNRTGSENHWTCSLSPSLFQTQSSPDPYLKSQQPARFRLNDEANEETSLEKDLARSLQAFRSRARTNERPSTAGSRLGSSATDATGDVPAARRVRPGTAGACRSADVTGAVAKRAAAKAQVVSRGIERARRKACDGIPTLSLLPRGLDRSRSVPSLTPNQAQPGISGLSRPSQSVLASTTLEPAFHERQAGGRHTIVFLRPDTRPNVHPRASSPVGACGASIPRCRSAGRVRAVSRTGLVRNNSPAILVSSMSPGTKQWLPEHGKPN